MLEKLYKLRGREYHESLSSIISLKFISFKTLTNKTKIISLESLSFNDYIDIGQKIINIIKKSNNDKIEFLERQINIYDLNPKKIKININKKITMIYKNYLIFSLIIFLFTKMEIIEINQLSILFILYIVFYKLDALFLLFDIKKHIAYNIEINDIVTINNNKYETRDINFIYTNSYYDKLEQQIRCLVIYSNNKRYIYYIDYNLKDFEIYYNLLCINLNEKFGNLYSNNTWLH